MNKFKEPPMIVFMDEQTQQVYQIYVGKEMRRFILEPPRLISTATTALTFAKTTELFNG